MDITRIKAALAHHWFLSVSGGEKVCEAIFEMLDKPDLFCILWDAKGIPPAMRGMKPTATFLENLPSVKKYHRYWAALFPLAVECLDLRGYDLVISSDSSCIKGVLTDPDTCHICYCHSPMRYAWNLFQEYQRELGPIRRLAFLSTMHYLRMWDYAAAQRVDFFVANSETVRQRIRKYYHRDSEVIYPPCDVERFSVANSVGDYYLYVGRLVPYKRVDLAIEVFNKNRKKLVVAGDGPQMSKLKSIASSNIEFLGFVDDNELTSLYAGCKALIFPGEEDFGLVPVEAQASGRPVIAFAKGGAMETVVHGKTGILFQSQTAKALDAAVKEFESLADSFDPHAIRNHAYSFDKRNFDRNFKSFVEFALNGFERRTGLPSKD
jgi:glycosyltransferase involved in cell wall biosynthesis